MSFSAIQIIIEHGKFQLDSLSNKDIKFDLIEFMAKLRAQEIFSLSEIEFAQIEANGGLSVIKKGDGCLNLLLVKSGQVLENQLARAGKDDKWLAAKLAEENIAIEEIFLVEYSGNNQLFIVKNDESVLIKKLTDEVLAG